ncbi:MAG: nuclear transport factor 2 family protein [Moraxellaceae bacterium]
MSNVIQQWHHMLQQRDFSVLNQLLADDVVFWSPVVHRPQQGKFMTMMYLNAAYQVLFNTSFRYVREVVGAHDAVLEFEVEIDGLLINGVDMIRWNDAGQIIDFKVMVRPLKAMNLLHQKMAEMLSKSSST